MKKQLIAAAVAASVSAVAMADISITGAAKVNYTNVDYAGSTADNNKFSQETDIKIKGKSGDTEVVINFGGGGLDNTGTAADAATARTGSTSQVANVEDVYMTTKAMGVNIKAGTWDNGNNELRASSRTDGKFQATTSVGSIDLGFFTNSSEGEEYTVGTDLGGVNLSFTKKNAGETVKASTTIAGVNVKYLGLPEDAANKDRSYYEVSTKVGDVSLKVGQADADSGAVLDGDTWLGDFEGNTSGHYYLTADQDITGIELGTSVAGNKVTFRNINVDGVAGEDTKINKVIVTRPLASGATFELTYTDVADDNATDTSTLDLELAVSF